MDRHRYFPAGLNVFGRPCLVIGQDEESIEKAVRLVDAGAKVTVVAPEIPAAAAEKLMFIGAKVLLRAIQPKDLTNQFLVILSARHNPGLTKTVAKICRQKKILLNALDQPEYCDVVNVSAYERGPLTIAASTSGVAPGLSKKVRQGLEKSLSQAPLEAFLSDLAELRARLEKDEPDAARRREKLLKAVEEFEFRAEVRFPANWRPKDRPTK